MSVRAVVTTFLDTLALLLLAAGVVLGLWPHLEGWSLACGGAVLMAGSWVADGGVASLRKERSP